MPYDEKMADRVRELIVEKESNIEEKKIFSGLCFMVNDKMCVSIKMDRIMIRIDPMITDEVLEQEGTSPMVHSGKAMKGFIYVSADRLTTTKGLRYWVDLALDFNARARSSHEKKPARKSAPRKR
jgi:TfoX/Sxy family transcriptional regulator of competence genes